MIYSVDIDEIASELERPSWHYSIYYNEEKYLQIEGQRINKTIQIYENE